MSDALQTSSEDLVGMMLRLRGHGVSDATLLKAVEAIPHQNFVPVEYFEKAWRPRTMPIVCGQIMHAPDVTIRMIEALRVGPAHTVLEIGTGSGYQTAILAKLAKKVHSIDRYKTLIKEATERLQQLEISNVTFAQADGRAGSGKQGLYDRIIADLAYDAMPRQLLEELVSGGIVVTAIGEVGEEQTIVRLTKIGSRFEREDLFKVRFGPFEAGVAQAL